MNHFHLDVSKLRLAVAFDVTELSVASVRVEWPSWKRRCVTRMAGIRVELTQKQAPEVPGVGGRGGGGGGWKREVEGGRVEDWVQWG